MNHIFTMEGLDHSEADHLSDILNSYRDGIKVSILNAMAKGDDALVLWYTKHLEWHDGIMKKAKWITK